MTVLSFQNFTQLLILSIIECIHCASSVVSTVDYRGKRCSNRFMLKCDIYKKHHSFFSLTECFDFFMHFMLAFRGLLPLAVFFCEHVYCVVCMLPTE